MKTTQKALLLLLALAAFGCGTALAVSTSYWTQNSQEDFQSGEAENVSISSRGTVALSGKVGDIEGLEEDFVWCMVRDSAGNTYVGTGGEGAIYKVSPGGSASLLVKLDEPNVTAMVAPPRGGIYAAGSPEAKVYKVSSTGDKELVCDLEETYVWSMAVSKQGTLYIATGDQGKIYQIKRGDDPEVLYDSPESHILALIRDDDGNLYAGTHPNALIYKIDSAGKPFVLFDADEDEIHALALGPDGSVFAATASGGRASLPAGPMQGSPAPPIGEVMLGGTDFPSADAAGPSSKNAGKKAGPPGPPRPPGTNSIYKIPPDGSVEKLFSGRNVLLYALAVASDHSILAAAASPGRIYRVLEKDRIVRLLQTDEAQVLSLLVEPDGNILFGTGNQGRLRRLEKARSETGVLTSEPLDAAMRSRWGSITWTVDLPENTSIGFSTRSGNSAEPDDTWSEWSEEMTEPDSEIQSPPARFLQYKADLSTRSDPSSPVIREVKVAYQTFNRPPEVLSVGAQAASNGPRQPGPGQPPQQQSKAPPGSIQIVWKPQDPNGDSLKFAVYYRHVDEEAWKLLEEDLEKPTYTWDTLSVPDADYRIRVVASDSPSNPEGQSLEGEKISDPVTVDNTRPEISGLAPIKKDRGGWSVPGRAHDETSPITGIEYSLDGGDWTALPAIDGILDSKEEFFSIEIEALDPGRHSVVVRAQDIRGNIGASRVMIEAQ